MARPYLYAIDPGVRGTGFAKFDRGRLVSIDVVRGDTIPGAIDAIAQDRRLVGMKLDNAEAVIEFPMIYPSRKMKGDPNDVLAVAAIAGAWILHLQGRGASVRVLRPFEWKGQLPKDVTAERASKVLTEIERRAVAAMLDRHGKVLGENAIDALALGLGYLERITLR